MTQSKNIPGSLCDITTESLCGSASASKLRQRQCLCYFQHFLFVCLFILSLPVFPWWNAAVCVHFRADVDLQIK